jgi:hypothetical protein
MGTARWLPPHLSVTGITFRVASFAQSWRLRGSGESCPFGAPTSGLSRARSTAAARLPAGRRTTHPTSGRPLDLGFPRLVNGVPAVGGPARHAGHAGPTVLPAIGPVPLLG